MPKLIERPTVVQAVGNRPKQIQEFAGLVNSGHTGVSIARMVSPSGWLAPGQLPQFEEITLVLRGMVRVEPEGAECIAVCMPAFSPATVHRDRE